MSMLRCHLCGSPMTEGSLKYQVVVRVRSLFDGAIPEIERAAGEPDLGQLLKDIDAFSEEELNRQVYEDDAFIMCLECKEAFMEEIYSRLRPEASPENGRAHLVH
jgi:tryptophanyl-tRNA synthetase